MAIFEFLGKQYRVNVDDSIMVDFIANKKPGDKIVFDKILVSDTTIGHPYVPNKKVEAIIEKHGKHTKIIVFKYRPKKKSRKKQGHRQQYTKLKIVAIA